jgi:hypothetical protein
LAKIPKVLHDHIDTAYPANTCQVATVLPDGYPQVTMRGSVMVLDDDRLAMWERGKGSTTENVEDGSKMTVFFRKPAIRDEGMLPKGAVARFYGTAEIHKSGPIYEDVWRRLIPAEKEKDPDKNGFAVVVNVERALDLGGVPLTEAAN